ncbi:MAG: dephospho-CoA kinase [Chlamydiae bacterium RIFCSPHIGHO2_12_FULL_44_59]|nr:MAG: dephospho-CoA kinase [Chlamydiae bacterium RIFCSPHIGHO2_01_FULL_44_39]OGN57070.1 MAG: dephospho-CoA kinase [Chlamydiae bacterium RIFCSPHIGHO2_02_FULL_45_9]OGN60005.1 MAG: dephospho-CoA kinase [Chlamydiae bacterium RIFCSPHIGHO2_12_FULL_44_59]OGN65932.1 MAG: dephospho-CoA kinase [Chlamydiae bacterium RIFCSPLOWO2_01_FULL_44_52]OGN68192.1 MAG: dephospho-CoA kinase [Chlamydiae bacterium RIFCSPLOWO2_02_FULL_45_22]OGN70026.1 MAG: dephospho-CoA kinase [Chlamydiae bacterium RIFCSPLOWO2_12_FULL_
MLRLKKIAVTGGIASGKSTVCRYLKELGAYTLSADAIGHELLNTLLFQTLIDTFGKEITENGKISRTLLANKVFQDEKALRMLEKLIHPFILKEIQEHYEAISQDFSFSAFVVEMPLLFEIGAEPFYDITITVLRTTEEAKKQAALNGCEYENRMKWQLPIEKKAALSDVIIPNFGNLQDLQREVTKFFEIGKNVP